ncbi:MAG TPA: ribosomal protein S18-alanine N-acetyltransferase [Candidatus Lumbricidophila sp.]|nr:ribosomal protein S18-alanine N-acetyltransferase [Candidatus Lumbricidophila sp.]
MLRRATPADLDTAYAIEHTVFADDSWSRELLAAELESPHTYYLLAVDAADDAVLGYCGLLAPARAGQADIQTIAVVEAARGRGLGRLLMQALLAEAWRREVRTVFLEVRIDNEPARSLYRSLGFVDGQIRRGYYAGVDAITMARELTAPQPQLTEVQQ